MPAWDRATLDEGEVRAALTVQFDACDGCRACVSYCGAFPLMFDLIHPAGGGERTAGDLVVAEQDRIVDACIRCGRCVEACPYQYDVPALADRARAMRTVHGQLGWRRQAAFAFRNFREKVQAGRRTT